MDERSEPLPLRATERMTLAFRQAAASRRSWFAVILAAIFALHTIILAVLLWHDDRPVPPPTEETAVEVVAQMPDAPAPALPKAPDPKPAATQPPERPATSAPRAQNDEALERDSGESETRAPKTKTASAAPPPVPEPSPEKPQPDPVQEASRDREPASPPPSEAKADSKPAEADAAKSEAEAPPEDPRDAEALDKAPPQPPRRPATLADRSPAPKPPAPKPPVPKPPVRPVRLASTAPRALPTAIDQLAGASELPDYVFAKPQRKPTKYKGGSEDNRYLAVVYAMVTQSHEAIPLPAGDWHVAVSFQVDGHGNLAGIELTQSSGYPEVDAAAINAVRSAAPFPPPPSGGVTGLIARLGSDHARAAAMARGR